MFNRWKKKPKPEVNLSNPSLALQNAILDYKKDNDEQKIQAMFSLNDVQKYLDNGSGELFEFGLTTRNEAVVNIIIAKVDMHKVDAHFKEHKLNLLTQVYMLVPTCLAPLINKDKTMDWSHYYFEAPLRITVLITAVQDKNLKSVKILAGMGGKQIPFSDELSDYYDKSLIIAKKYEKSIDRTSTEIYQVLKTAKTRINEFRQQRREIITGLCFFPVVLTPLITDYLDAALPKPLVEVKPPIKVKPSIPRIGR